MFDVRRSARLRTASALAAGRSPSRDVGPCRHRHNKRGLPTFIRRSRELGSIPAVSLSGRVVRAPATRGRTGVGNHQAVRKRAGRRTRRGRRVHCRRGVPPRAGSGWSSDSVRVTGVGWLVVADREPDTRATPGRAPDRQPHLWSRVSAPPDTAGTPVGARPRLAAVRRSEAHYGILLSVEPRAWPWFPAAGACVSVQRRFWPRRHIVRGSVSGRRQ